MKNTFKSVQSYRKFLNFQTFLKKNALQSIFKNKGQCTREKPHPQSLDPSSSPVRGEIGRGSRMKSEKWKVKSEKWHLDGKANARGNAMWDRS